MPSDAVPEVTSVDKSQWKPEEYGLLYQFVNFARMANSVVTEPGPLQGWFSEALWRHYSYAPFNARVMENYHSLAFFYGYEAPWNIYYKDPEVLRRLELALNYTFDLMGENGAIPEYATADMDTPMLAPSSFGMEYMAGCLEVAGDVLPEGLKKRLVEQARKAAVYVLTSEESWDHARAFTNQFLGSMSGGARLARLTDDAGLMALVEKAGDALLEEGSFMSPMGFMYENSGPETFAYFFVTLHRLIPLYHEWPDARVLEVLRRHCAWMSRWMLLEPDGETVILAGSHQTRTGGGYRLSTRSQGGIGALLATKDQAPRTQNGLEKLLTDGSDERRFIKLFLGSQEAEEEKRKAWEAEEDPMGVCRGRALRQGYNPVSTLALYPPYVPPETEIAQVRGSLPCLEEKPFCQTQEDDRGNQYVFIRFPTYYTGLAFATRRSTAQHGPGFLWLDGGGTVILSENGERACWETAAGGKGTSKATALAEVREGRGGHEVILRYDEPALRKAYVYRPEGIDVQISARGGNATERIPLLLREDDVVHLDYGRCPAGGMSSRVLGVVTQTLGIERGGKRLLTFDFGAPVHASLKPAYDADGYVRVTLAFPPPAIFFGKTGYRVRIGE